MKYQRVLAIGVFVVMNIVLATSLTAFAADNLQIPFNPDDANLVGNPNTGAADDVTQTSPNAGQTILAETILLVVDVIKFLVASLAIAWIVWGSLLLVTSSGEEDKVSSAKQGITWASLALLLMLLVDTAIFDVLYGGRNGLDPGSITESPETLERVKDTAILETLALLEWLKGLLILIAVAFVMISGFKMITALGETEQISQQKVVFQWVGIGIVVILINDVLIREVIYPNLLGDDWEVTYNPDAETGVREAVAIIQYFLQFLAVIAFVVFLYGGSVWVLSFGDQDRIETGKKTLTGAILGIIVILVSYVVTSTFASGVVQ